MNTTILSDIKKIISRTGAAFKIALDSYRKNNKDIELTVKELLNSGWKTFTNNADTKRIVTMHSSDRSKSAFLILGTQTDFCASSDDFKALHMELLTLIFNNQALAGEELKYKLGLASTKLGESIVICEQEVFSSENEKTFSYTHHNKKKAVLYNFQNSNEANNKELEVLALNLLLNNARTIELAQEESKKLNFKDLIITKVKIVTFD